MTGSMLAAVAVVGLWIGCIRSERCQSAFDVANLLEHQLLPNWFELTPSKLQDTLKAELEVVANGSGPLLRFNGETCEALFGFAGNHLETVSVYARGPKGAVVEAARVLALSVGLPLTASVITQLNDGEVIDLSERLPADPRIPGAIKMLNLELSTEQTWVLRLRFRYTRDP